MMSLGYSILQNASWPTSYVRFISEFIYYKNINKSLERNHQYSLGQTWTFITRKLNINDKFSLTFFLHGESETLKT